MTSVWRIGWCPEPQPSDQALLAQLGHGSTLGQGRWHHKGPVQVVYCGASRALCQLEKRVHSNGANPKGQALMRLDLPAKASLVDAVKLGLPSNWRDDETATRAIGQAWALSGASLGLWVPSYVEPAEHNLILNPAHPDYRKIKLTIERKPFQFDPRLFGASLA